MHKPQYTEAELIALAALVIADAVEVVAANQVREQLGQAPAYDGFYPNPHADLLSTELRRRKVVSWQAGG